MKGRKKDKRLTNADYIKRLDGRQEALTKLRCCFFFSLHFYSFRFKVCVCWCSYRSCTLYTWPIVVLICFFPFLLSIFQLNFFPSRHRTIGAFRNLCIYDGVQQCDFARFELASQIPFRRCSFHVRLQKVEATNAHVYDIFFWNELRN